MTQPAKVLERQQPRVVSLKPRKKRVAVQEREEYCLIAFYLFSYQLSGRELAEAANVPRPLISTLEKEGWPLSQKVSMKHVYQICRYFNCSVEQFIVPMTAAEASRLHMKFLSLILRCLPSQGGFEEESDLQQA